MTDLSKLAATFQTLFPKENEQEWHSMLASWGKKGDDDIRQTGTAIQSPLVPMDSKLNFEQRILNPNSYPTIDNGDGSISTHRMAWGGDEGNFKAFPTIIQDKAGKLVQMEPMDAQRYAEKTGEYRHFTDAKDAESYAEGGYKKFWGLGERK